MKFYTTTVYSWRKIKKLNIAFIDTTVKSGNKLFAPTWPLLAKYKSGEIDAEEYTKVFYELMRDSYKNHPEEWDALFEHDILALACYCKAGNFCHRLLLKDILLKIAKSKGVDIEYLGEI